MTIPSSLGIQLLTITLLVTACQTNLRAAQPIEVFTEPYQVIEVAAAVPTTGARSCSMMKRLISRIASGSS